MKSYSQVLIIFFTVHSTIIDASFGGDFRNFVHERYGSDIVHLLERMDLGKEASVGGSEVGEPRFEGQPVIIVHGITNKISRFNVSCSFERFNLTLNLGHHSRTAQARKQKRSFWNYSNFNTYYV